MEHEIDDAIVHHFFRYGGLLYRSAVILAEYNVYAVCLERRLLDVWEPVPGTIRVFDTRNKAEKYAKKLLEPLQHIPLINLAYFVPPEQRVTDNEDVFVRVSPGSEEFLYKIGDYLIRKIGPHYVLHVWNGFGAVKIDNPFFSLEAAAIAAIVRAKKDAKELKDKPPVVKEVPIIVDSFPVAQEHEFGDWLVTTNDGDEDLYDAQVPTDRD